jgi:hypothetical protein
MHDPLTEHSINLEPVRPGLFSFPINEDAFWFVREEVEILQSRYGKSLPDAIQLVNKLHGTRRLTKDDDRFHNTPLHHVRAALEGDYWKKEGEGDSPSHDSGDVVN